MIYWEIEMPLACGYPLFGWSTFIFLGGIMDKLYFIINPLAASGRAAVVWRDCKHYLDRHHMEYEAFITSYAGHAAELAADLTDKEERVIEKTIVVIGGDGTLGDVISGIHVSAEVTLAYLPGGSGNDFARSNHLAVRPVKRLKQILRRKRVVWMDYGIISYIQGELHQRRFAVSCGVGMDAAICRGIQNSPLKNFFNRIHLGRFVYIGVGLKHIFCEKPYSARLVVDGVKKIDLDSVRFISIHVHPSEGGGFRMAPHAECQDGQFDLCVVSCKNRLHLIRIMLAALVGRHIRMKGVHIIQCVTAAFRTDRPLCVHTDGEDCGHLDDFTVLCERRKLKMIL